MKPSKKSAPKFAILPRVSTRDQEPKHSLFLQEKGGRAYVKRLGGTVVKVYPARESATGEDRAALDDLLNDAEHKHFDAVVVEEPTRLSRNPATMFAAMTRLAKAGVALHDFEGPLPFDTPEGEFKLMMESVVGRYTARQGVQKSIRARLHVLQSGGIAAGRPPWGRHWNKADKRFEVIKERLAQIRRTYDLIVTQRRSFNYAAARIQATAGLPIPRSSLRKAISQAALTQVTQRLERKEYSIPCPPLLTKVEQQRIEARIVANVIVRPETKGRYLLQGLVRCDSCGATMTGQSNTKDGRRYRFYRHPSKLYKKGCTWQVPALLDDYVLGDCAEVVGNGKALRSAIKDAIVKGSTGRTDLLSRCDTIKAEIRVADQRLRKSLDLLERLDARSESWKIQHGRMKSNERQIMALRLEYAELEKQRSAVQLPIKTADVIAEKVRNLYFGHGIHARISLDFERRRQFVRVIVGRTKRDSKEGIFVHMIRVPGASKKDVYWQYRLQGALALSENGFTPNRSSVEFGQGQGYPEVLEIRSPTPDQIGQLARIANESRRRHVNVQIHRKGAFRGCTSP